MSMQSSLKDMFVSMKSLSSGDAEVNSKEPLSSKPSDGNKPANAKPPNKRLSVERIYQKKTQLEHILLRPDSYIGTVNFQTQQSWVLNEECTKMIQKELNYVPGLYKIFDEILVNAADNKQRDPKMNTIKIDINPEENLVKIWNNGRGIPIVEHKEHNMYVPTMIFGYLLTSSNYDDTQEKVTGGRNGFGAKLCNIYSDKFIVETQYQEEKKYFKQTWTENMTKTKPPIIKDSKGEDFTCVSFYPDLKRFKMEKLDSDICALFTRRAYDVAASTHNVKVILNGKRIPVKNFREYINLYLQDLKDDTGMPLTVIHEQVNDRWEVAIALSDQGFQQVSFVNSIATTKGGRHVDYVSDQVITKLIDIVKKKDKAGVAIRPFQVKNHLWIFVNCLIVNPTFDSQTKENLTLLAKNFGSKCVLTENFMKKVTKAGIVESILSWMKFKAQTQMSKKIHGAKANKLKGIPKLDDANDAGTKNSLYCTLILTEGDSAKTLAVAGLGVVGRDKYGVFPLRGKVLNVREASHKQILENAEIGNIVKICGLQFKEKYETMDSMKSLRYGKILIMTDQDQDGSHIKGLLINLIHHFWPNLLKHNFIEEFITPIIKVSKNNKEQSFYSIPEYDEWKKNTDNWHTYKIKYYKGLGTSTSKEAKEYFSDMTRHKIPFKYSGIDDEHAIMLAFSKKKADERKEWMLKWMESRKERSELGLPELILYGKERKHISYSDFVNRELILFSNMDLERSIPSIVDGLKPGQRKVIFTCLQRNDKREVKVAQLAGSVGERSAYHHGEASLMSTIINLAQNFVGSNNLNLLLPIGQFGTRLHGGKDAASPRYIFTMLSPLAKLLFNPHDTPVLKPQYDDNQKVEPEFYVPLIPLVLVNGAEGIGTGWSTKIPNYDVRAIIENIRRLLRNEEPSHMIPSYKNFRGTVTELSSNRYYISGEVSIIDDDQIEITELPIRTWTQNYKEDVLELMLHGSEKVKPVISNYNEYHTDTTVKFSVKMTPETLNRFEDQGLHKSFKLHTSLTTNSMVLFDSHGCVRHYQTVLDILREFYDVRMSYYVKRKTYLINLLTAESRRLENMARFIMEKIKNEIKIENVPKKELIQVLLRRGYDSDPVKAWKAELENNAELDNETEEEEDEADSPADFNYILGMPLWSLTRERKDDILKQRDDKCQDLESLRRKTPKDLYNNDLDEFEAELEAFEKREKDEQNIALQNSLKQSKLKAGRVTKNVALEITPSRHGRRVEPKIDQDVLEKHLKEGKKLAKKELKMDSDNKQKKMDEFLSQDAADEDNEEGLAKRVVKKVASKVKKITKDNKQNKSPVKKKPKKKRTFDSDSDGDSNITISDESDVEEIAPRERGPRRQAAAKVKYAFDEDEDNDEEEDENIERNDVMAPDSDVDDVASSANNQRTNFNISDEEFIEEDAATNTQHSEDVVLFDSDEELANGISDKEEEVIPASKPAAKKAISEPIVFNNNTDDESDASNLFQPTPEKKTKVKATKSAGQQKPKANAKKPSSKPKPVKEKAKPQKRTKATTASDASSDDEFAKKPVKKSKKTKDSDDDFCLDDSEIVKPTTSRLQGRSKAAVKYFDSDESDY